MAKSPQNVLGILLSYKRSWNMHASPLDYPWDPLDVLIRLVSQFMTSVSNLMYNSSQNFVNAINPQQVSFFGEVTHSCIYWIRTMYLNFINRCRTTLFCHQIIINNSDTKSFLQKMCLWLPAQSVYSANLYFSISVRF